MEKIKFKENIKPQYYKRLIRMARKKIYENIVFQKLYLLSKVEKKARIIEFQGDCINILIGPNDTGKSHLLRMLYWTLGCEPAVIHPTWQNLNVKTLLQFTIDDDTFLHIVMEKYYNI